LKTRSLSGASAGEAFAFMLPLTRETLADYLGLTIETVSRQISALRRDGVVSLTGQREILIPDFRRLLDETGDDYSGNVLP